ncbi:MAG: DinB family protein [Acidobacteriota bacterium]|nr:DinB family protein [Acidobacteriota bacterium]
MDLTAATTAYEESTLIFLDAASRLTDTVLDRHVEGGWSARQIVHHLADAEAQGYARLRRLLAEPDGSIIQGYDEAAWADCAALGYRDLPIAHSLAVFAAVRAASADILGRLSEADLERYALHSSTGHYSVATWITTYTKHPRDHAAQMAEAIRP